MVEEAEWSGALSSARPPLAKQIIFAGLTPLTGHSNETLLTVANFTNLICGGHLVKDWIRALSD